MRELEYPNDQDIVIARGVYQNYIKTQTVLPAIANSVLKMLIIHPFGKFKYLKFVHEIRFLIFPGKLYSFVHATYI